MTDTMQLDLSRLLPDVTDVHDACLMRLISSLEAHQGIEGAHVVEGPAHAPSQLCVHYDAHMLPEGRVADLTAALSEALCIHFGHLTVRIASPRKTCEAVERLRGLSGIRSVEGEVDGWLRVEYNRDRTSEPAIRAVLRDVVCPQPDLGG